MTTWQASTSERLRTLESDHRSLLIAFGAAFVVILGSMTGAYLSLATKQDAGFERVSAKIDSLASAVGDVKADVAVLKSDVAVLKADVAELKRGPTART